MRIRRVGICGTDIHAYMGTQPYFSYPRILGHELSGEIVETEDGVGYRAGDPVTIIPYFNCGRCIACINGKPNCCARLQVCGVHVDGGMVEYLRVPASALMKGNGLSYDELALVEPLAIRAHGIRRAAVQPGEFVVVIGSGPIGLAAIQFAKISGAVVIAVDVKEERLNFCRNELDVEHVINAGMENVGAAVAEITSGDMATVVIDASGNQKAINGGLEYLAHGGRYVLIGLQKNDLIFNHPEFHKRESTLMSSRNATRKDFEFVMECLKARLINPLNYITHRVEFGKVKEVFESGLPTRNGVIKIMVNAGEIPGKMNE